MLVGVGVLDWDGGGVGYVMYGVLRCVEWWRRCWEFSVKDVDVVHV